MKILQNNWLQEGDFVVHPEYNRGLTTIIEHLSRDRKYAIIKDGNRFVNTPSAELVKYEPKDE